MNEIKRPRLQLLALSLGALLLAACGASTPSTPQTQPIAGATLNIQLSEDPSSTGWTLGAANVELFQYTGINNENGATITSGSVDTTGKGTLTLPGEAAGASDKATLPATEAVLWLPEAFGGKCTNTVTSSNASAKVLLVVQGDFSTQNGGGQLFAAHGNSSLDYDMLTYSTAATTVSGDLVCPEQTYSLSITLNAGWNIAESQLGQGFFKVVTLPLNTTVQLSRTTMQ